MTVEEQRNVSTESCGGKTDGCRTTGAAAGRSANNGPREYIALVLLTIALVTEGELKTKSGNNSNMVRSSMFIHLRFIPQHY